MKVVLAGGSGLIGRSICAQLLEAGHQPVVLTRRTRRHRHLPAGVRAVRWDPRVAGPWSGELADAGAVINLAGASIGRWPWTRRRKATLLQSRLVPTRALVGAIRALPEGSRPRVFLSASGTDLYEGRDAAQADETTATAETFLARLCLAWEAEAAQAGELGPRVVLMRTSTVLAPGAPVLRVLALPLRLWLGGRLGSGRQWMSWVDIVDVARMYRWALETDGIAGPVNVAAPDPRPQAEFARALGSALRRPAWFATPAWLIRLVLRDQATLALGSRRVWPSKALLVGFRFRLPQLEDALAHAVGSVPREAAQGTPHTDGRT